MRTDREFQIYVYHKRQPTTVKTQEVTMLSAPLTRLLLLLSFLLPIVFLISPARAESGLLDGKVFVADAGAKGKSADEKDEVITFRDGRFHSSSCDQWGYSKGIYKAKSDGDAIVFETETISEKDGRLVWTGRVRGDAIEGVFTHYRNPTWHNKNPAPVEHWFKGKVKPS